MKLNKRSLKVSLFLIVFAFVLSACSSYGGDTTIDVLSGFEEVRVVGVPFPVQIKITSIDFTIFNEIAGYVSVTIDSEFPSVDTACSYSDLGEPGIFGVIADCLVTFDDVFRGNVYIEWQPQKHHDIYDRGKFTNDFISVIFLEPDDLISTTTTIIDTTWAGKENDTPLLAGDTVTVDVSVSADTTDQNSHEVAGEITISGGGGTCTITLPDNACDLTVTQNGAFDLTATYGGLHGAYAGSFETITLATEKLDALLSVSSSQNPSSVGGAVEVAVAVPKGSGGELASGEVEITIPEDGFSCTITLKGDAGKNSSKGDCNWTPSGVGTYAVGASYAGDDQFNPSSDSASHTVEKATSTTSIDQVISPNLSIQGETATFYVSVSGSGGQTPTGNVDVSGAGGSCTATLDANGEGNCSYQMKQVGQHTVTAKYGGDGVYEASSGTISYGVIELPPEAEQESSCDTSVDGDCDGVTNYYDECLASADPENVDVYGCP